MLNTLLLVRLNELTNRTFVLPLAVFFPTSRCNSRCISCDWWRASGEHDLALDEIRPIAASLASFGTRVLLFSGGEPLLRPDVFEIAHLFRERGIALHLHTSGILLERCAERVAQTFERVIVSLDSPDEEGYKAIRGVSGLQVLERGIAALRRIDRGRRITARATLHRRNFRDLPRLIEHARAAALDGISFLAADVSSSAFGRTRQQDPRLLALSRVEIAEFAEVIERTLVDRAGDFDSGFVAESPAKLRRLPQYYAALAGFEPFPEVACNAPYVSVVIEADGTVRPCFFHEPIGNVRHAPLDVLLRDRLPRFRSTLSVATDPVCERCVCSIRVGVRSPAWL